MPASPSRPLIESRGSKRKRALHSWSVALAAGALSAFAGCKTETPHENYASAGRSGGPGPGGAGPGGVTGSGGAQAGSAGSAGNAGSAGSAAGDGGTSGGAGDAGSDASIVDPNFGCGTAPFSEAPFTRVALRAAAADCAMWEYCRFEGAATELRDQLRAHAAQRTEASLAKARSAWSGAMSMWSNVEMFQFGPLGSKVESAGRDPVHGQGIRDLVYSWPIVARCRVEEQVIGRGYQTSWATAVVSGRGLFALEYLLFYPGADTACGPSTATATTWATSNENEIASAKLDYALALSDDVLSRVQALRGLWSPNGANFKQTLVDAAGYDNEQQALNVMAWSLIYLEKEVKDWKLGIPAGFTLTSPVSVAETPFALDGTNAIRQNLRGFRALFQGCGPNGEGLGFDDWLSAVGAPQLATDMIAALDRAQAAADAFPPIEQASAQQASALYLAVKELTNLLKSDFFGPGSILNLKLPAGVEGDTD